MEIRARYFLIGLFVLGVIASAAGFVYWLYGFGGLEQRTSYQIRFAGTVNGLSVGSEVVFNGVTVGEVTRLALDPAQPGEVVVTVAVVDSAPVRSDTKAGLTFSGLTGAAKVALVGGTNTAPRVTATAGKTPELVADNTALADLTAAARNTLGQIDAVIGDNREALRDAIASIDTFAGALARNSDKVDSIVQGLAGLTGGGTPKPYGTTYALTAPTAFPSGLAAPRGQLLITRPSALLGTTSQRILIASAGGDTAIFDNVKWTDELPAMVQAKAAEAFQNAGYVRVVDDLGSSPGDFQLQLDLRTFHIVPTPAPAAEASFAAKVLTADGHVLDASTFSAMVPIGSINDSMVVVACLDAAFHEVMTDVVVWALARLVAAEATAPQATGK